MRIVLFLLLAALSAQAQECYGHRLSLVRFTGGQLAGVANGLLSSR